VAQALGFADTINTVGAPSFAVFCEGRVLRTPAAAKLGHSIPERNPRPAFIHAHRPGFVQKIETITAPRPLLRCANEAGHAWIFETNNDSLSPVFQVTIDEGSVEMAISGDGSALITADFLADSNLNAITEVGYVDRDVWLPIAVYGQKLNSNGSLMFQQLTNGIDVIDGTTGLLQHRVALPLQAANVYDALAVDNTDGLIL
jgi:hypothetical protein